MPKSLSEIHKNPENEHKMKHTSHTQSYIYIYKIKSDLLGI